MTSPWPLVLLTWPHRARTVGLQVRAATPRAALVSESPAPAPPRPAPEPLGPGGGATQGGKARLGPPGRR